MKMPLTVNRGTFLFNLSLCLLVALSFASHYFPHFVAPAIGASLILSIAAPWAAHQCEQFKKPRVLTQVKTRHQSVEDDSDLIAEDTSASSGKFDKNFINFIEEKAQVLNHEDAFSVLIRELHHHADRREKIRSPDTSEDFSVTLKIINVYIGNPSSEKISDKAELPEFILRPDLHSAIANTASDFN